MSEFNKYSTDGGATFIDVEDSNAVHWGDQSKGYVGKNELIVDAVSETKNGVTFTVNEDKSITLNNTATSTWGWNISEPSATSNLRSLRGSYILSFEGTLASGCGISLQLSDGNYVNLSNSTPTQTVTFTDSVYATGRLHIYIVSGSAWNNVTIKPMLRNASISNSTYEPFYPTNIDLENNKVNWVDADGYISKNLFHYDNRNIHPGYVYKEDGLTFTVNDDYSITINGTNSTADNISFIGAAGSTGNYFDLKAGSYIFSGHDNSGNVIMDTYNAAWTGRTIINGDTPVVYTQDTNHVFRIYVQPNKTVDNVTVYPMIRKRSIVDNVYEPNILSNADLSEHFLPIEINSSRDLNDYTKSGYYYISTTPANSPENVSFAAMLVFERTPSDRKQIIFGASAIYIRAYGGSPAEWLAWKKVALTTV